MAACFPLCLSCSCYLLHFHSEKQKNPVFCSSSCPHPHPHARSPGRAVGWCGLPQLLPPPLPPRASPVCRLCRRAPRASPVSRLSRRVERRVARPSPPSLPPRASLVSQLRCGALGPVRCAGCAAGWSLAPPPPSGQSASRLCCGFKLICEHLKVVAKSRTSRARASWPLRYPGRPWVLGSWASATAGPTPRVYVPPVGCP